MSHFGVGCYFPIFVQLSIDLPISISGFRMFNKIRSFHTPKSSLVTESELTEAPFFGSKNDIGSEKNEVQIDKKKIGGIPT